MIEDYTEERQNTATLMRIQQGVDMGATVKLRTTVHCDSSYPEQSRAQIEVWHEESLSWHQVATAIVPPHSFTVKYTTAKQVATVLADRAMEVLGLETIIDL